MKLRRGIFSIELGHDLQLVGRFDWLDDNSWYVMAADALGENLGGVLAKGEGEIPDAVIGAARARAIMLYPDRISEPNEDAVERLVESVKKAPPVAPHAYERDRKNADDPWGCKHCPLGAHDPIHTVPTLKVPR